MKPKAIDFLATVGLIFMIAPRDAVSAPTLQWIRQFGTSASDYNNVGRSAADGAGNFYVAGTTYGDLSSTSAGSADGYIRKYDVTGSLLWSRQFGTVGEDSVSGASIDGDGSIYLSGATHGDLGGPNAGDGDLFLRKYNPEGEVLWTRQQGTPLIDLSNGVSADALVGQRHFPSR